MKSLLNKTLLQYVGCTLIVLLLATPIFYLLTKYYYAEDVIDLLEAIERGQNVPQMDLERDILKGVMIQFFLIFFVLSCSMFLMMRVVTRKIWQPFDDTLKKMEHFNLEQCSEPVFETTDIKEFHRLNEAVSLLIKRNRDSYRTQKEFTENASHELQTPLAIAKMKLDLLLQEDLNEQQSEIVGELYRACNRMSRLNKNLLLLARIENAQYADEKQIDLCDFVQNQLPLFEDLRGGISVDFIRPNHAPKLNANEVLLESLLGNLVVNAIRSSTITQRISIEVTSHSLIVSNESNNGPLDAERIFHRFQFTNDIKRGNGLGLSIVKAICDFHGWKIRYAYENNVHIFTVDFLTEM